MAAHAQKTSGSKGCSNMVALGPVLMKPACLPACNYCSTKSRASLYVQGSNSSNLASMAESGSLDTHLSLSSKKRNNHIGSQWHSCSNA